MGIKYLENTESFEVLASKRHPVTRQAKTLKRRCNDKGEPIKSRAEAQRIFNAMMIEINDSFKVAQKSPRTLYRDVLPKFYDVLELSDFSRKTVENYRLCLNAHTLSLWGHREIDSIRSEEVRHLIKSTLSERSPSQQKNVLKFIRKFFQFAVEEGYLAKSPVPLMQFRMGDKIKKVLTETQLRYFLDKAKEFQSPWYPVWVTAVYTGLRNGELFALTWDKVDLENRKIVVSSAWNSKDGFKDLTKSGVDRVAEIAPPLLAMLKELKLKSDDTNFVLPRPEGWIEGRQAEFLRYFLIGISLPPVRFHDLRASWATVMLARGIPPVKVMAMGGWKDLKTMMIYVRKSGIDIQGITDGLILHNTSRELAAVLELRKSDLS